MIYTRRDSMLVEKSDAVSIWIGDITDAQLQTYVLDEGTCLDEPINEFAADMDDYSYDSDMLDVVHEEKRVIGTRELISKLAYSDSFIEEVVQAVEQRELSPINCALGLYRQELQLEAWPSGSPLDFVGTFKFS